MKKNIVIVVLVVVTFISLVYPFIQQTKASVAQKQAEMNLVLAISAQKEAEVNATEAIRQQHLAREEAAMLQQQMEECKKKK